MGIPVPAETALIGAALLAHRGHLDIATLTVLAATAAILGDNVGFAIGRHFGRRIFLAPGPLRVHRGKVLEHGEPFFARHGPKAVFRGPARRGGHGGRVPERGAPFFARHGPKAVFLGRWVAGLRIASSWLAGMNKMPWPTFVFWNALGGILWATSVSLSIYFLGD